MSTHGSICPNAIAAMNCGIFSASTEDVAEAVLYLASDRAPFIIDAALLTK